MPVEDGIKSKMSIHSSGFNESKSAEKINISIKKCKNLITQKPEGLTIYAKLDFNENVIAESPKLTVTTSDVVPDFNFTTSFAISVNEPISLDDLAYKPVIVTLIEVLPKEKKQKEEKIQPFGQAVFDLFSLIKGETNASIKVPVFATPGSTLEAQSADLPLPELEIYLYIEQPLLNADDFNKSNILTVNLESMYALPDSWNNSSKEYAYTVSIPIPLNEDKDNAVTFVNGLVKSNIDVINKQKRWPDTRGILTPNAVYIPNAYITEEQNGEEQGDFQSKEDKEYRSSSEKDKPKIVWNVERRCFLSNSSNTALRDQLMKARYMPIEIIRTLVPTGAKGKKDEDLAMSYHGVSYIDMAPLLYPGATQIKGAFKVVPYVETEYFSKTKKKAGIVEETLKVVNSLFDRNFAIMPIKKEINKTVEKKDNKKNPRESNIDGHEMSQSVAQLMEAKSFIVIDIKFDKPLIPRKPFDMLAKRVAELIPPRPKYPLRTNSAEKAVTDYHAQIKAILYSVLDDYRNVFIDNEFKDSKIVDIDFESKKRKLLYELNSTGKYFAFKEQLKNSVIKIVREKFLKTSALNDTDYLQQFLSELYVFLIDELHKALNGVLTIDDTSLIEHNLIDNNQMKHFALEAEMNRNFDLAAYYYQERIAMDKNNYNNWLDYAVFNLLIDDYSRCEECLKECISINQNEITGLLLYSVICAIQEKYDLAETFLEKVTTQEPENIIGWTLLAILYEQKGQELNAEITMKKTLKINQAILNEMANLNSSLNHVPTETDLEGSVIKREEEGAAEEDTLSKAQQSDFLNKSRTSKRGTLTQIPKIKGDNKSPKLASAKNFLENTSALIKEKNTNDVINKSVFLKTSKFLIKYNAFSWAEKCMAKELVNPNGGPNGQYHMLLAKIKLAKNQLEEAEKHITESLAFDYQNCQAWISWGHVRYLLGDFKDAKEKYERCLLFPDLPSDQTHSIYIRLASIYLKEENYEDSKRLFLYPCKYSPSCMSWLGVGICCYRLSQLEEAKNALCEANILNNKAPEVWAYLSLICLRTNKPLEAEQAYKYAMKLNLDNPELLEEIHMLQEKVGFGNPEF